MIQVRIVDDEEELARNQLKSFYTVLKNAQESEKFKSRFSVGYDDSNDKLTFVCDNETVIIENCIVSLANVQDYETEINRNILPGFIGEKRILIVDYALDGIKHVEDDFYIKLKKHCKKELIYTRWSNYEKEDIDRLKKKGCYFVERAVSDDNDKQLNWRATMSAEKCPYIKAMQMLKAKNKTISELCLELAQTDNVNLRFLATILLLIGKLY